MRSPRFRAFVFVLMTAAAMPAHSQQANGTLVVQVSSDSQPVAQAEVTIGNRMAVTDATGQATFELPAGMVEIHVERYGLKPEVAQASISDGAVTRVRIELEKASVGNEEITVKATRSDVRIEDEPLRVEVLDHEEVEEKALMTPGDIAMMLNETSGLHVQVTSPSLGAANVRIQGLNGRYTQLLSDGLPLYGGQSGAIGLLQIPPLDLGQVEVIKGTASALYGPSALGGVINLVSRRTDKHEREALVNATTRNGEDATVWFADPLKRGWAYTLLGGAHIQRADDINGDGWADLPKYRRAEVRPRFFWNNGAGRSLFATVGGMAEQRSGGTLGNATVPDGQSFPEELGTRRFDGGLVGQLLAGNHPVTIRGSFMSQGHHHLFGQTLERDRRETWFGETSINGTKNNHTWVLGSALQADTYRSKDVPLMNYTYVVPAVFAQDEYAIGKSTTLSASARIDAHNKYGILFNPRLSALFRLPRKFTARLSAGTGVFAPTPFTEDTEAVGLSKLMPLTNIKEERARSASGDLGWSSSHIELNGTLFGSVIRDPIILRSALSGAPGALEIVNADGPTRTIGSELLARLHSGDFGLVLTHTFVQSSGIDWEENRRNLVPLTPKHTAGIVGTWEREQQWRVGVEMFYTGQQRLEDNPYRNHSVPYHVFGLLVERHFGPLRIFANGENLNNVRQTKYDPLLRPQPNFDGRWTVDEWAPLEGRIINGGLRLSF